MANHSVKSNLKRTIKVALTQMQPGLDVKLNLEQALGLIELAKPQNPDLVLLPENALCIGTNQQMRDAAITFDGPEIAALCKAAQEARSAIVLGGAKCRNADGVICNSAIIINKEGKVLGHYDKIHLFNAQVEGKQFNASAVEQAGADMVLVSLEDVTIGITICYDIRFPELYRNLAYNGAEIILVPAAFTIPTGKAHWDALLRARAIENSCYIVASATIGSAETTEFPTFGHAAIIDPWGEIVVGLGTIEQAVQVHEIQLDKVWSTRASLRVLESARPDVYGKQVITIS
ncbi:carbon-nitrogen hydrolase family protein [Advenella sp. WQ 585]|uniref:Carbon-nitrogen hydrolase family protein n=1 Tax=Advenella mandrilli TaxID=2800330 RepID=A0ABS1E9E8_9BURK|nr:nitrilase-related carbon-nitrogen hydrolase [Advenella mandrilli]MBK1780392.1 carbon-nitrogen hydrolase family protein [Advenella mandrilli]NLY34627.1 carbon-nitrogen hydrolase [Alcaligenaceae bacterium]